MIARSLREMLALVLLAGFYLIAGSLTLIGVVLTYAWISSGITGIVVFVTSGGWDSQLFFERPFTTLYSALGRPTLLILLGVYVGVPLVMSTIRGLRAASTPRSARIVGCVQLHPEAAPKLWKLVTDLAMQVRTSAPVELWLTADANAWVREDARLLGGRAEVRQLYIGVPLLVGLSVGELRTVLCHELGHCAGRHTLFSTVALRGSVGLASSRWDLNDAAERFRISGWKWLLLPWTPWRWPWVLFAAYKVILDAYALLYDSLTFAVRRWHEIGADATAARIVGGTSAAEALRKTHMLAIAWDGFRFRMLDPMCAAGHVPDDPFEAFRRVLASSQYRFEEDCPSERRSFLDSHPPLSKRLAKLEHYAGSTSASNRSPATTLLTGWQAQSIRVWGTLHSEQTIPVHEWLNVTSKHNETFATSRGHTLPLMTRPRRGGQSRLRLKKPTPFPINAGPYMPAKHT